MVEEKLEEGTAVSEDEGSEEEVGTVEEAEDEGSEEETPSEEGE